MKRKRLELNRPTMMPVAVWCSTVKYRFGTLMKTLWPPGQLADECRLMRLPPTCSTPRDGALGLSFA
jgi:hypothetical protein